MEKRIESIWKKYYGFIIAVILIVSLCYTLFWLRRYSSPQIFGKAFLSIKTNEKIIALTFDDGPNPESTHIILELLQKYNAKATFFLVGENVEKYPDIVAKTYLNGNELGNHSYNHTRLLFKRLKYIDYQITKTDDLIRKIGYDGEIYFRAPFGHKLFILSYYLMQNNRIHILYSIVLNDWEYTDIEKMMNIFDKLVKPGSIVLLHDGYTGEYQSRQPTTEVVRRILEKYTEMGYRFVTVSELINIRN
jgi:chitin deacetylase